MKEYDGGSRFMDYKTKKFENRSIDVFKTGIYVFRFSNSAIGGRVCRYSIKRIPANDQTKQFNTTVYWRMQNDTTYSVKQERYLVKRVLTPKTVIEPTEHYINGGLNASLMGGKSRITFLVQVPPNTVEWYYQVSASRKKEDIEKVKTAYMLVGKLGNALTQGVPVDRLIQVLTAPPGADYCDVYVTDYANSTMFAAKTGYKHFPLASRENIKSGIVRVNFPIQNPTVCLKNPSTSYGVNVIIEVVALVQEEEWGMREVKVPNVSSNQVPYFQ
ncbi:MAG: hypothetical protein EOP04_18895 [Proteobacteria bacterium]|nr:MAG: hypothetical protein EOP04_18895 [Pseudomonadota bacterium]